LLVLEPNASSQKQQDAMTGQLTAKCRLPTGGVSEIEILDINEGGCLVKKGRMRMEDGDRVLVKLPGLEHKAAYIAWVEDEQAGFTFEEPLYGPTLKHLLIRAGAEQPAA